MPDPGSLSRISRRRRRRQLLGGGLLSYGIVGIAIFAFVAISINKPLERIRELTQSVEDQRVVLLQAMDQTETTIREMAVSVRRMDTSLGDVHAATDRSSGIAQGVAASMFQLRDAMSLSILGAQPLIGLASGFDQAGGQLQLLSQDLTTIGTSIDTNRSDAIATSDDLNRMADLVSSLTESIRTGPGLAISEDSLGSLRLALVAVAGWLLLLAVGCALLGIYLIVAGRRDTRAGTA